MKQINGILTAKGAEIPLILDAITWVEGALMRSTSDNENIQKALDDPKEKEKMNNSIKKFLDLNKLVNSFEGPWPKECHSSPIFKKEFRDMLDTMTVEDYFNMLAKQVLNKESKT